MIERVHRDEGEGAAVRAVRRRARRSRRRSTAASTCPRAATSIFDYAEAFTVIDVNTGRFVGSRSKTSTQRLEDTIVKNNLEAVKEVVRQLRLRDIGGIIVIDFIDMANPKNRQAVEEALRTELERDRTKTYVVEISPLGLVEMTRQNVTDGPREVMTRKCPTCGGDGIVVSDATVALQVERKLCALAAAGAGSRVQAYRVAVHPRTLAAARGPGGARLAELEEATRRRFFLVPAEGHAHGDHFEVLAEGKLDDLRAGLAGREGCRGRAEARRDRAPRRARRRREARRRRRDRRRRGEARRQEGEGRRRPRARRARRSRRSSRRAARRADHVRERGREADARAGAAQGATRHGRRCRAGGGDDAADATPSRRRGRAVDEIDEIDARRARRARTRRSRARLPAEDGGRRAPAKKRRAAARAAAGGGRSRRRRTSEGEPTDGRARRPTTGRRADADVSPSGAGGRGQAGRRRACPRRRAPRIHVPADDAAAAERRRARDAAERRRRPRPSGGTAADEAVDEDDRRADGREEADAPRVARRPEPEEEAGRDERRRDVVADTGVETAAVAEAATAVETLGGAGRGAAPTATRTSRRGSRPPGADRRLRGGGYVPMSEWIERLRPAAVSRHSGPTSSATIRRLAGVCPRFPRQKASSMSYAIISVGGKQYRVREGERLLVDRLALEDGATFTPPVLLSAATATRRSPLPTSSSPRRSSPRRRARRSASASTRSAPGTSATRASARR